MSIGIQYTITPRDGGSNYNPNVNVTRRRRFPNLAVIFAFPIDLNLDRFRNAYFLVRAFGNAKLVGAKGLVQFLCMDSNNPERISMMGYCAPYGCVQRRTITTR